MNDKFNILLTGQLAEDKTLAEVLTNLAALFKISREHVSDLLAQAPVVIKASIDKDTCDKYIAPVERAGARCRAEPASQLASNLAVAPAASPKAAEAPVTAAPPVSEPDELVTAKPLPAQAFADPPTRETSRSALFSPDESIQFEGSVVRQAAASFPNFFKNGGGRIPSNLYCFITNKRVLLFAEDKLFLDLPESEIQKIAKVRLGSTIWHGENETTLAFADKARGETALARMKAGSSESDLPQLAHEDHHASSALWGWLIATSPLIGSAVNAALIKYYGVRVIMLWYAICAVLALIDRLMMRGRHTSTNVPGYPYFVPWYLFSRARTLKQSKGYAVVGCIVFAAALGAEALHFYQRFTHGY